MSNIRMIASDIDGTLLRDDGTVSERTRAAIRAAQRQGVLFTVCTGRYPEHADVILRLQGLRCPISGNNGATQWDSGSGRVLSDHFLPSDAARAIAACAARLQTDFILFAPRRVIASSDDALHISQERFGDRLTAEYGIRFEAGPQAVARALTKPVNKFYFRYSLPAQREALTDAFAAIPDIQITTSGHANVEIIPVGCNKASGVAAMAALHGIDLSQVMTVGDYENDVPMLTAAGLGVAMGNASPAIQALAGHVTATNNQDGLALAIERFVLDGKSEA